MKNKNILIFLGGFVSAIMLMTILLAMIVSGIFGDRAQNNVLSVFGVSPPVPVEDVEENSAGSNTEPKVTIKGGKTYTYIGVDPLVCREDPDGSSREVYTLTSGELISVCGEKGDYYKLFTGLGYAYGPKDMFMEGRHFAVLNGAVDLRGYLPEAVFDIDFASDNNITGTSLYPPVPLMEAGTAKMLLEAYEKFKADGYIMKICDAYRPKSAQVALYNVVQNSAFIANPASGGSWHNVGRAVDMSLVYEDTGVELEMPTRMHTFDYSASRYNSSRWTEEARENVEYMTSVMQSVGFTTITSEWWHFEYTGSGGYMTHNLDYHTLRYE